LDLEKKVVTKSAWEEWEKDTIEIWNEEKKEHTPEEYKFLASNAGRGISARIRKLKQRCLWWICVSAFEFTIISVLLYVFSKLY